MKFKLFFITLLLVLNVFASSAQNSSQKSKEKITRYENQIKKLYQEKLEFSDSLNDLNKIIQTLNAIKTEKINAENRNTKKLKLQDSIAQDSVKIKSLQKSIWDFQSKNVDENLVAKKKLIKDKLQNFKNNRSTEIKLFNDTLNVLKMNLEELKKQYSSENNTNANTNQKNNNPQEIGKLLIDTFNEKLKRLCILEFPNSAIANNLKSQINNCLKLNFWNGSDILKLSEIKDKVEYISTCFDWIEKTDAFLNSPYDKLKMNQITSQLQFFVSDNKVNAQIKKTLTKKLSLLSAYCNLNLKVYDIYMLIKQKIDRTLIIDQINELKPQIKKEDFPYLDDILEKYKTANNSNLTPFMACQQ